MVGEVYPVGAVTNADCSMALNVTSWLALYPNATFRAQLRASSGDPVVRYEWAGGGGEFKGRAQVVPAGSKKLLLMKMPARDAQRVGPLAGVYDIAIEDPAIDMKRVICGGPFNIEYGVTV